ncbi:hypothetical protein OHS18_42895 [Amycolatopsis sp. NBC_00355]|uniref:hypothetical protein n=1 Tax=Amycolatopsis sp. NBC_00355 TaxID=2975957 RepID=UPI002E272C47
MGTRVRAVRDHRELVRQRRRRSAWPGGCGSSGPGIGPGSRRAEIARLTAATSTWWLPSTSDTPRWEA